MDQTGPGHNLPPQPARLSERNGGEATWSPFLRGLREAARLVRHLQEYAAGKTSVGESLSKYGSPRSIGAGTAERGRDATHRLSCGKGVLRVRSRRRGEWPAPSATASGI